MIYSRAMFCIECGQTNDDRAMYCQSCGNTFQPKPSSVVYAGFWQRFAAVVIDAIVVSTGIALVSVVSFGAATVPAWIFGHWIYEAWMTSSEWQATLGKRALGIVVTGLDGGRISFARATGRHFAKWISTAIVFIGYIMAAFTERKQALHDMIAETLVVNRAA